MEGTAVVAEDVDGARLGLTIGNINGYALGMIDSCDDDIWGGMVDGLTLGIEFGFVLRVPEG